MDRLSEHVSYKEAVRSNTAERKGIDNTPNANQLENMIVLCEAIFEPLRIWANNPIYISSFFRSETLNKEVGGSETSKHCAIIGAAIDLDADVYGGKSNAELFHFIRTNLSFDKLVWEFGSASNPSWVHVSYNEYNNRGLIYTAYRNSEGIAECIKM